VEKSIANSKPIIACIFTSLKESHAASVVSRYHLQAISESVQHSTGC